MAHGATADQLVEDNAVGCLKVEKKAAAAGSGEARGKGSKYIMSWREGERERERRAGHMRALG